MALSLAQNCVPSAFSPSVYGTEIQSLEANLITNYSATVPAAFRYTSPSVQLQNATFCNVTVTYTHTGQNENVVTEAWLPMEWNERFMAVGGGGWVAGRFFLSYNAMLGALADGFATITTDAGLGSATEPSSWAQVSRGNVNLYNLQNLGSISLNDQALIGKSLIKSFYGRAQKYSYWNGCSQGGRQGLMVAQRYPTAFDGIAAGAPAINWNKLVTFVQWPQQIMNELGQWPYMCELDAITLAAVSACDKLDGVIDGIISDVGKCFDAFDPFSVVGETTACAQLNGTQKTITKAAANVLNATWHGRITADGKKDYHGILPGSDLTGNLPKSFGQPGIVATACTEKGCTGMPSNLGTLWFKLFVAKNASLDMTSLTREEFDGLAYSGTQQYASLLETNDADLRAFKAAGGKMVTFHGLADNVIPPGGTEDYYNAVTDIIPEVHDFYRYFEIPGLGHCFGGVSESPTGLFRQLRDWVENGTAPENTPIEVTVSNMIHHRILCPYPQTSIFGQECGDASKNECWHCSGDNLISSYTKRPAQPWNEL
ncbi:putative feruloyl esterase B [Colletotrichum spaethianum]|uniref:Carboxylic ester hydrolase n=1 Tax=Colletotrichum spaethianum TaxID=700344 RepID=A0AA37UN27_9PEZI|nr:putative feruloyl esterase B [Colletotrichum spaethianum]GKT47760.1 putative feruloyl esterase B [Colletotrichum spaethianum]